MKDDDELPEDDGVLVEKGAFKVDRAKALETLTRFRSPDAGPVLFLARAASAAGAKELKVSWTGPTLEVSFDGRPYSASELADPYAALFEEESPEAVRYLALTLLHAYRPGLDGLSVVSGGAGTFTELTGDHAGAEKAAPVEGGSDGTTVTFSCRSRDAGMLAHPVPAGEIACRPQSHFWGALASTFSLDGAVVGRYRPREAGLGELLVSEGGQRLFLALLPPPETRGLVDLYQRGVYAGRVRAADDAPDIVGKADDPKLRLNASYTSLVRSERIADLRAAFRRHSWDLAVKVAGESAERLPQTGRLLRQDPRLETLWRRRFARGADAELDELAGGRLSDDAERVLHDAAATAWLRETCVKLLSKAPEKARAALKEAPLFLSTGGKPLTLGAIQAKRPKPLKAVPNLGDPGSPAPVWCETAPAEADLRRLQKG